MSKDQIMQTQNSQKTLNQPNKGTKKKMASDDDQMVGDWEQSRVCNINTNNTFEFIELQPQHHNADIVNKVLLETGEAPDPGAKTQTKKSANDSSLIKTQWSKLKSIIEEK